jgi:hypothetical protein
MPSTFKITSREDRMKAFLASIFVLSSVFTTSTPAAAQPRASGRTVQLIPMSILPQPQVTPEVPEGGGREDEAVVAVHADARNAFAVHDLQRRWVEFQMVNNFSAASLPDPRALVRDAAPIPDVRRDPLADLSIPEWMRSGAYIAPLGVKSGCSPVPYQPTGFLGFAAESRRAAYYSLMSDAACEHGIPVGLFDAMIIQESRYNAAAVSPKNAFGLTQLMPDTALGLGVDRFDPAQNLKGGARYIRQQLDRFGHFHLALAAYNAGPGNIKNGLVPPFAETRAYVDVVLSSWRKLAFGSRTASIQSTANSVNGGRSERSASPPVRAASVSVF